MFTGQRLARLQSLRSLILGEIEPSVIPVFDQLSVLESLSVEINEAPDLEPIARLPELKKFQASGNGIVTLGAFRDANKLSNLEINSAPNYATLDFIGENNLLQSIRIEMVPLGNLEPLRNSRHLRTLALGWLDVESFSALTSLTELEKLEIVYPARC